VGLRALTACSALCAALLAPSGAAAHSLVRVGGGQVNYIAKDATSLNKLKVRPSRGSIELLDRSVDGGMDPGPCRPGDVTDDVNSWIVQVFCGSSGIRRVHADLGEREDAATVSARVAVTLLGGPGADRLTGGPRPDTVDGGDGNDRLAGAGGADELDGGLGTDTLDGGPADDVLRSADGLADRIDCGEGTDRLEADTLDTVEGGCESVSRRAVPPPAGGQTGDDTTAPVVEAGGSTLQRLGRGGRVSIAATSSERGFLAASGSLEVAGLALPLQSNRRRVSVAGAGVELTVRLRGRAMRECRRGLRRGRRAVVRMRVVGTDAAGNSAAVQAPSIRLRR
jgi:RTX calcium-binding nonapeptide repeat (4 copies)